MMPVPSNILRRFCAIDPVRESLHDLITDDTYRMATCGAVLIRTRFDVMDVVPLPSSRSILTRIYEIFVGAPADSPCWEKIPSFADELTECPSCKGVGTPDKCESCDGRGEIFIRENRQEAFWCEDCEGTGNFTTKHGDCIHCQGHQKILPESREVYLAGSFFDSKLLAQLWSLPGAPEIHPNPRGDLIGPHPIRGDGWDGVLMPYKPKHLKPIMKGGKCVGFKMKGVRGWVPFVAPAPGKAVAS